MALHFDLTGIENSDELYNADGTDLDGVTKTIVFATMNVGIGSINDENAGEFYARLTILDKLMGPFIIDDNNKSLLTPEVIIRHIGLKTNVAKESRPAWTKRVMTYVIDENARKLAIMRHN
jgi:hypothetical protein